MLTLSWSRGWQALGASGDGAGLMQELIAAYREPQRRYHTLQHLSECIDIFQIYWDCAENPGAVEMALWFHDAVYDVRGGDNEQQSAFWAEAALRSAAVDEGSVRRVKNLVLATRHHVKPQGRDQELLVDIDLGIFGAQEERFEEYEKQVRAEYAWVPDASFREARRKILEQFLGRPSIYYTHRFRELFEASARKNLEQSVARLTT